MTHSGSGKCGRSLARIVVYITVLFFFCWGPVRAQVTQVDQLKYPPLGELIIPEPERIVLENGLVVLLMEDHELPLVTASAMIRTGSRWEPERKLD